MLTTALAGLVLGLGGVTAGTGLVQASERSGLVEFFETLFGAPPRKVEVEAPRPRRPVHYASLPDARRVTATHVVRQTPRSLVAARPVRRKPVARVAAPVIATTAMLGARTVCVRACDGYLFPLGRLAARTDLPVHEAACAAACPNAETRLFTLGASEIELDRAVGVDGRPYRTLTQANLYRTKRVDQCSCQPDRVAAPLLPLHRDLTLRAGDVVATATSARVVVPARSGGFTVVDFREARGLSRRARRDIDAKVDAIRREAEIRAFRKAVRVADQGGRIRVAAMGAGRAEGGGFGSATRPPQGEPAFAPVRVVVASPFLD